MCPLTRCARFPAPPRPWRSRHAHACSHSRPPPPAAPRLYRSRRGTAAGVRAAQAGSSPPPSSAHHPTDCKEELVVPISGIPPTGTMHSLALQPHATCCMQSARHRLAELCSSCPRNKTFFLGFLVRRSSVRSFLTVAHEAVWAAHLKVSQPLKGSLRGALSQAQNHLVLHACC